MALTARLTFLRSELLDADDGNGDRDQDKDIVEEEEEEEDPEELFGSALGVIFPDDVTNQHGDAQHALAYTSPHLRRPLRLRLGDPDAESDRSLFSHFLWNSSLLLAELVEAGTLGVPLDYPSPSSSSSSAAAGGSKGEGGGGGGGGEGGGGEEAGENESSRRRRSPGTGTGSARDVSQFDITDASVLELGAGTALPSLLACLLGARRVLVTDYPSPAVLSVLRANVAANARAEVSPLEGARTLSPIAVAGHAWGQLEGGGGGGEEDKDNGDDDDDDDDDDDKDDDKGLAAREKGSFDRVFVCDCLWMPWQHENLRRSIAWFMRDGDASRAWVVAGFHTGRAKVAAFFDAAGLAGVGLEVESIWERDCGGVERDWCVDRGIEDVGERKRWLVVGVLKRRRR
ncbi:hypothetical protein F4778DRAFT_775755 [Xylariomycetidae sp. FL2044]|nr:hypothetical protein F4778DRAFT_775755 [Xylariomycetidae sp. FL2044]